MGPIKVLRPSYLRAPTPFCVSVGAGRGTHRSISRTRIPNCLLQCDSTSATWRSMASLQYELAELRDPVLVGNAIGISSFGNICNYVPRLTLWLPRVLVFWYVLFRCLDTLWCSLFLRCQFSSLLRYILIRCRVTISVLFLFCHTTLSPLLGYRFEPLLSGTIFEGFWNFFRIVHCSVFLINTLHTSCFRTFCLQTLASQSCSSLDVTGQVSQPHTQAV
jgi:hypothetical protein